MITLHVCVAARSVLSGPAFNYVLGTAYVDKVDYFYRINDDTVFTSPFASALVAALQTFGPPYGVVGPKCDDGNT